MASDLILSSLLAASTDLRNGVAAQLETERKRVNAETAASVAASNAASAGSGDAKDITVEATVTDTDPVEASAVTITAVELTCSDASLPPLAGSDPPSRKGNCGCVAKDALGNTYSCGAWVEWYIG